MKDLDGRQLLRNTMWMEWFSSAHDVPLGVDSNFVYDDRVAKEISDIDKWVRDHGEIVSKEMTQTFPDGTEHILNMTKFPIRDTDGSIFAVASIDRDITDRKKAEADLRASEERVRSLLEVSPIGFALTRSTGDVLMTNNSLQSILGIDDNSSEVLDIASVYENPDDRKQYVDALQKDGHVSGFETQWRRTDGSLIWVTMSARMVDYDGDRAILAWTDDVTERKDAEKRIVEKEAQLRMALDNMPGAMWVVDRDLKLVFGNDRYKEYYGDPDGIFVPGVDFINVIRKEAEREQLGGEGSVEEIIEERVASYRSKDDTAYDDITIDGRYMKLLRQPAQNGYVVSVATDVTEQKKLEEEIRTREERFSLAMSGSGGGLFDWDVKTDRLYIAPEIRFAMGMEPDQTHVDAAFLGDRVHPDDVEAVSAAEQAAIDGKADKFDYEYRIRGLDDVYRWVHDRGMIQWDEDGNAARMNGATTDITPRKEAEAELANAYEIIRSSINYASRIQRSILPDDDLISAILSDHFILWEPRDVVGGDVYWAGTWDDGFMVMLGDCTGHGVPGAFMTLISIASFERAMQDVDPGNVGELIQRTHQYIQLTLRQQSDGGESDDGIELGVCYLAAELDELVFVGARFELFLVEDGMVSVIKGTKSGLGYRGVPLIQEFEEHRIIELQSKTFYMTSDGLIGQVGGDRNRSFGKKRFKEQLLSLSGQSMSEQKDSIHAALNEFQGSEVRRDDVSVIGFTV